MGKWRPDSIEKFQEAAALADRHYRLGSVPIATYVELQKQYLEAVEALLDTKTEALESAQRLEVLTGISLSLASTNPPTLTP
jgi:cobalt-zinc-cadmium efflux system outer membrane protein